MRPHEGDQYTFERTFTHGDVRGFADLSADTQPMHLEPDEEGRLVLHGLLTASLSTKIGSDLGVLASRMEFDFLAPVYTGQTVTCTWTTERVEERESSYDISATIVCENGDGERVLEGVVEGLVRKGDDGDGGDEGDDGDVGNESDGGDEDESD